MPISPDEALAWVEKRWKKDPPCELCGTSDWGVSEGVAIHLTVTNAENVLGVERSMPFVPVICKYCGNTKFIHEAVIRTEGGLS